jgi:hypothetical protein
MQVDSASEIEPVVWGDHVTTASPPGESHFVAPYQTPAAIAIAASAAMVAAAAR